MYKSLTKLVNLISVMALVISIVFLTVFCITFSGCPEHTELTDGGDPTPIQPNIRPWQGEYYNLADSLCLYFKCINGNDNGYDIYKASYGKIRKGGSIYTKNETYYVPLQWDKFLAVQTSFRNCIHKWESGWKTCIQNNPDIYPNNKAIDVTLQGEQWYELMLQENTYLGNDPNGSEDEYEYFMEFKLPPAVSLPKSNLLKFVNPVK